MNYKDEIKAIIFDFDGTLINFEYEYSKYTLKALKLLSETDYKICLASGRPCYLALKAFRNYFGDCRIDYVFGCNGSEMMNLKENKTDILFPLKADEVQYLGKVFTDPIVTLGIYNEEEFLVNHEVSDPVIQEWMKARWVKPIVYDFTSNDIERSKVLLLSNPKDRKIVEEIINNTDLSNYNSFFSSKICYEIAPKGISKAKSCELLAKEINCDMKQILSFGDMENDLDMLLATTGVAMANASDNIKKQIPLMTGHVEKEGIYLFLHENSLI